MDFLFLQTVLHAAESPEFATKVLSKLSFMIGVWNPEAVESTEKRKNLGFFLLNDSKSQRW